MSGSLSPTTMMLWLSWPMLLGERAVHGAEALDEGAPDVAVLAMALEHGELERARGRVGQTEAVPPGQRHGQVLGQQRMFERADHRAGGSGGPDLEEVGGDRRRA